jgi:hypothetical protein
LLLLFRGYVPTSIACYTHPVPVVPVDAANAECKPYQLAPSLSPAAAKRRQCVAQFSAWYGTGLLQAQSVERDRGSSRWRLLVRPLCSLPFLGCVYL